MFKIGYIFSFAAGIVTGALLTKEYFKNKEMEFEQRIIDEQRDIEEEKRKERKEQVEDILKEEGYLSNNSEPTLDDIRKRNANESKKKREYVDYTKKYNVHNKYQEELPNDEVINITEEEKDIENVQEMLVMDENKNRRPIVITDEEIGDLPSYYEEESLFYYEEDMVLADEDGNEVESEELLIGDCLEESGILEISEPNRSIYVQNFDTCKVYYVTICTGRFINEWIQE